MTSSCQCSNQCRKIYPNKTRNHKTSICNRGNVCDGSGKCVPNFEKNGVACGEPEDECSFSEVCHDGLCVKRYKPAGTICGDAPAGICDDYDRCDVSYLCVVTFVALIFLYHHIHRVLIISETHTGCGAMCQSG